MTTDFEDSEKWTSGPQTAQAKQKVSDVTTKHGARKAEIYFDKGRPFPGKLKDMLNEVIGNTPALGTLIDEGGLLGESAMRYAQAEVVRRTWYAALGQAKTWEQAGYFSDHLAKWVKLTDAMGQKLDRAIKEKNDPFNYENMLSLSKIMQTDDNDP